MLTPKELRHQLRLSLAEKELELMKAVREVANLNPQDWPDGKLLPHTRRGLDRAVFNRLTTQPDILNFLSFRHLFGERFDEFPAVRKFLDRNDLPASQRMQLMMLELPMAIWDVVIRRTPPGHSALGIDREEKP